MKDRTFGDLRPGTVLERETTGQRGVVHGQFGSATLVTWLYNTHRDTMTRYAKVDTLLEWGVTEVYPRSSEDTRTCSTDE